MTWTRTQLQNMKEAMEAIAKDIPSTEEQQKMTQYWQQQANDSRPTAACMPGSQHHHSIEQAANQKHIDRPRYHRHKQPDTLKQQGDSQQQGNPYPRILQNPSLTIYFLGITQHQAAQAPHQLDAPAIQ